MSGLDLLIIFIAWHVFWLAIGIVVQVQSSASKPISRPASRSVDPRATGSLRSPTPGA